MEALLSNLARGFKAFDSITAASVKQLQAFDSASQKTVANLRAIETAATKAGAALKGVHGGHGGGERHEGAEGLFGGLNKALQASALYLTTRELGEAFEGLIDKVNEAAEAHERQIATFALAGFANPEGAREELGKTLPNVPQAYIAQAVAEAARLNFKAGTEQNGITRIVESAFKLAGKGGVGIATELISDISKRTLRGGELGFLNNILRQHGGAELTAKSSPEERFQALIKASEDVTGNIDSVTFATKRVSEAFEELFSNPPKEWLESLNHIEAIFRDKDTIKLFDDGIAAVGNTLKFVAEVSQSVARDMAEAWKFYTGQAPDVQTNPASSLSPEALNRAKKFGVPIPNDVDADAARDTQQLLDALSAANGATPAHDMVMQVGSSGVKFAQRVDPSDVGVFMKPGGAINEATQGSSKGSSSVSVSPGAVTMTFHISQQPGESGEEISKRIANQVPIIFNQLFEAMTIQSSGGIP